MRKPVGVIVATVILGVMTAFGLLGAVAEWAWTLLIHNPLMPTGSLGHQVRLFLTVFDLILVCILAWCAWTVVGLARMRVWARYSIVVLGVLTAVFFGAISALTLYMSKFIRGPLSASGMSAGSHPGAIVVGISFFYAAVAVIGIWWIVYFNLKHVRQAFAAARNQLEDARVDGVAAPLRNE